VEIVCPYCGETVTVTVDEGGGSAQRYVEDCSVCCRPIEISVGTSEDGDFEVAGTRMDE
jgi:transposase-like protein